VCEKVTSYSAKLDVVIEVPGIGAIDPHREPPAPLVSKTEPAVLWRVAEGRRASAIPMDPARNEWRGNELPRDFAAEP
jgi:hypothetical protein